jgi:DNA-binding LytR/AlgR family response regulator
MDRGVILIKIAICDDDTAALHQTRKYIEEYEKFRFHIDEFHSGKELIETEGHYDIILLDIDMPEMNGLETAKLLRQRDKNVKLIYITNYSDYTIFAFAVHAFAYLLKPLKRQELYRQLEEALEYMAPGSIPLLEFQGEEGLLRIPSTDILYLEYLNRKVFLHTIREVHTMRCKITELGKRLEAYDFFMPHKSFIVNLYAVKNIRGYEILLTDQSTIPLSQKKSLAFRKALNFYLSERRR